MVKNHTLFQRTGFAWAGLRVAYQRERSLRTEVRLALGWYVLLAVLQPAGFWWWLSLLASALVLGAELLNTSIEHALDLLHPGRHPEVKVVKDCAAAAVLVSVIAAVAVGIGTLWSVWS